MSHIAIVDDDAAFTTATAELLCRQGFNVTTAFDLAGARKILASGGIDILLLDVLLPDGSGLDLLQELSTEAPLRIVIMTAHPTIDVAVDSLRARAADFLVKPVAPQALIDCLKAIERALARTTPIAPSTDLTPAFEQFVGNAPAMLEIYRLIERVAPSRASVLIRGPSGSGKELVAQAIHARSERYQQPFLSLNCGAVSSELIGSELFGHERGSFTGATRQHRGYFERAKGGTLFLDEITEMPLALQVQLLRVLETDNLTRLGGDQEIAVDARIVAATNRDPQAAIKEGLLREDLYFRLAVFPIQMPTLRERASDIPLLAEYFLSQLNKAEGSKKQFASDTLAFLQQQPWPGNVRELKNAVQRAFILADSELSPADFPTAQTTEATISVNADGLKVAVGTPIDKVERQLIYATLNQYHGDKTKTAEVLGISLKTLYNRLKQYQEP